jgi:hypothetical protein
LQIKKTFDVAPNSGSMPNISAYFFLRFSK